LRFINGDLYGAWLATGGFIAVFGMVDFGLFSVLTQKVAKASGDKNNNLLGQLIQSSIIISVILSLLPTLLGYIFSPFIANMVNVPAFGKSTLINAILISSVYASFMVFNYGAGAIFMGLQETTKPTIFDLTFGIISLIITVLLFRLGYGLVSIPIGLVIRASATSITNHILLYLWKSNNNLIKNKLSFDYSLLKSLLKQSTRVFLDKIAKILVQHSNRFIIAAMVDPALTAIMVFSQKSSELLNSLVIQISRSIMPSLAHISSDQNIDRYILLNKLTIKSMLIFVLYISGGIILYNKYFVYMWVGGDYYAGNIFTFLIVIYGIAFVLNSSFYSILFAAGQITKVSNASIIESLIKIPTSIILCYLFEINGLIVASIFAIITSSFIIQFSATLELIKISWLRSITIFIKKIFLAIIPVSFGLLINYKHEPQGLSQLMMYGVLYSLIFYTIFYFLDSDLKMIKGVLTPKRFWK